MVSLLKVEAELIAKKWLSKAHKVSCGILFWSVLALPVFAHAAGGQDPPKGEAANTLSIGESAQPEIVLTDEHAPEVKVSLPQNVTLPGGKTVQFREVDLKFRNSSFTFKIQEGPANEEQSKQYGELAPDKRGLFDERRIQTLTQVARILTWGRPALGVGSIVKNKLVQIVTLKGWRKKPLDEVILASDQAQAAAGSTLAPPVPTSISERGRQVIESILQAVDTELWNKSALISERDIFGAEVFAGVGAGILFRKIGTFPNTGIALRFGWDYHSKTFVFAIFSDSDLGTEAYPFVGEAILSTRFTLFFSREPGLDKPLQMQKGRVFYGYGPVGSMDTANTVNIGYYQGWGFPPLFDFFYAWTAKLNRVPLLQVNLNPLHLKSLKIKGYRPEWTRMTITEAAKAIAKTPKLIFSRNCLKGLKGFFWRKESSRLNPRFDAADYFAGQSP